MSVHVIKYYRGNQCISQFVGDDQTITDAVFHMNFYSFLPADFIVTKRTADHKEYALKFISGGGYSWVEVQLNNPQKELNNG
jgi:hypothetical protein